MIACYKSTAHDRHALFIDRTHMYIRTYMYVCVYYTACYVHVASVMPADSTLSSQDVETGNTNGKKNLKTFFKNLKPANFNNVNH